MILRCTAFLVLATGLLATASARAEMDRKPISIAACQPLHIGAITDPNLLRFTPEGITNYSKAPLYVICPLPKDAESPWNEEFKRFISIEFYQEKSGASVFQNACSLTLGKKPGPQKTKTILALDPDLDGLGFVVFSEDSGPHEDSQGPATLVCKIAPLNSLLAISMEEG